MTGAITKLVTGDWGYSHEEVPDLEGKTIVVTGASAGIGYEVAKALANRRAKVIALGKPTDIEAAKEAMKATGEVTMNNTSTTGLGNAELAGKVQWEAVEFENLKDVQALAKRLSGELERLDVLVCNAGLGVNAYKATADGFDSHLTVNNLSHVILTNHLLPVLRKTTTMPGVQPGSVRIVGQSSELHRPEMLRDVKYASVDEFKQDIGPAPLYNRTKLAVILFDKALAQKVLTPEGDKIRVYSTHPGAVATGQPNQFPDAFGALGEAMLATIKPVMRTPEHGSLSLLWASVAPEASEYEQGTYFTDPKEPGKETSQGKDMDLADNFWNTSQEVIKQVVGPDALIPWNKA